ncbi:hypothetical protein KIPB_010780, partial [Kipferlia bialata]|eukprot:g10780.t1
MTDDALDLNAIARVTSVVSDTSCAEGSEAEDEAPISMAVITPGGSGKPVQPDQPDMFGFVA